MSRSLDCLEKIKKEILDDTRGMGYAGKSTAEIAVLMTKDIAQDPPVFVTQSRSILNILAAKNLSGTDSDKVKAAAIAAGLVDSNDTKDVSVEVLTRRADELSLGDVMQGDVESALAV